VSAALGYNGGPSLWEPQPGPQSLAVGAQFVGELMFGGARGGGKSDFLLGDFLQDIGLGEVWRGIIFRRSYPELEELITRAKEIYALVGATWKVADKTFVFPGGATLKMRHVETESDCDKYQGHQYTWIGWDELTNWPNLKSYKKLKACLRSAHGVPNKRIRSSANPGGVGHHEVKAYFVDPHPTGFELIENTDEDGYVTTKMFIPSRVYDNKKLLDNDPGYISRLREIGSPELVRAWLEGDWSVITGAYFPEFSLAKHVLEPFKIPTHWLRFRSMDWGSASPFCILWHAVATEGYQLTEDIYLPSGAIITYRELYGWNGTPNSGLRWNASRVAQEIRRYEKGDRITYGVLDPSAFSRDSGPSHGERMAMEDVFFRKADNNRIGGWDMVRDRLCGNDGDPDVNYGVGVPMWYVFKTCVHIIRTLPALQHDINDPEDCDTDGEDHAPDTLRYGFMSRPWRRPKPVPLESKYKLLQNATMNDLWEANELYED
jgi:Terminase large subunit, T4likevirus-type, N-terminal